MKFMGWSDRAFREARTDTIVAAYELMIEHGKNVPGQEHSIEMG